MEQQPSLNTLDMTFVPNMGQVDSAIAFQSQSLGGTLDFTASGVRFTLPPALPPTPERALRSPRDHRPPLPAQTLTLRFAGANAAPAISPVGAPVGTTSVQVGDPSTWRSDLPSYTGVTYQQLYPGIDLVLTGAAGRLKSTYTVAPGSDTGAIRWEYDGAEIIMVDAATGDLHITLPAQHDGTTPLTPTVLVEHAPVAWQEHDGQQVPVTVQYVIDGAGRIGFALGAYDATLPLIIDPEVTYLARSFPLSGYGGAIAAAADGSVYLVTNPWGSGSQYDLYVARYAPGQSTPSAAVLLGGSRFDFGNAIAVGADGALVITGDTESADFAAAAQQPLHSFVGTSCATWYPGCTYRDAFVLRLDTATLTPTFGTFLGGQYDDMGTGVAVGSDGQIAVVGTTWSPGFAAGAMAAPAAGSNGFLALLTPTTNSYQFAAGSFIGGGRDDAARDVVIAADGAIVVTGATDGLFGGEVSEPGDSFVARFQPNGQPAWFSTWGTPDDDERSIAVALHATGQPTTLIEQFSSAAASRRVLLVEWGAHGSAAERSTLAAGSESIYAEDMVADQSGNLYAAVGGDTTTVFLVAAGESTPGAPIAFEPASLRLAVDGRNDVYALGQVFQQSGYLAKIAGVPGPVQLTITDAAGQPVQALKNKNGWPLLNANEMGSVSNPLTVTVTLRNAEQAEHAATATLVLNSEQQRIRFNVFTAPQLPEPQSCLPPTLDLHNDNLWSFLRYQMSCDILLQPGETRMLRWQVWVQPSDAGTLSAEATLAVGGVPRTLQKQVAVPLAAIHPIMFVPGITATQPAATASPARADELLWAGDRSLAGFSANYQVFYTALEKLGYEKNRTYFRFPWSWLDDVTHTAAQMRDIALKPSAKLAVEVSYVAADSNRNATSVTFDMVAHSGGNLVVRAYLEQPSGFEGYVHRYVSVGGIHHGLVEGYQLLEGNLTEHDRLPLFSTVLSNVLLRASLQNLPGYETQQCIGFFCIPAMDSEDFYAYAHDPFNGATIVPQALPTYEDPAYLQDAQTKQPFPFGRIANPLLEASDVVTAQTEGSGAVIDPYTNDFVKRWVLDERYPGQSFATTYWGLNTPAMMQNLRNRIGQGVCIIYASNSPTTRTALEVVERQPRFSGPYWLTGEVEKTVQATQGDGLVPVVSANPTDIWQGAEVFHYNISDDRTDQAVHAALVSYPETHTQIAKCFLGQEMSFLNPKNDQSAQTQSTGLAIQHDAVQGVTIANTSHRSMLFAAGRPVELAYAATDKSVAASLHAGQPVRRSTIHQATQTDTLSRTLLLYASGPIAFTFTDPQGRRLGYNPAGSSDLREIPNGQYGIDAEGTPFGSIYDPLPGDGTLTIVGTGTGVYRITGIYYDSTGVAGLFAFDGQITPGAVITERVRIPGQASDYPQPPDASMSINNPAIAGQPVAFTGKLLDGNPNDTHAIAWDFGDGTTANGTLTPIHTYAQPGIYMVTLTVTDSAGFKDQASQRLTVEAPIMTPTTTVTHTPTSTNTPTAMPTSTPTVVPTVTSSPTSTPTPASTATPTAMPTSPPTATPTSTPTAPPADVVVRHAPVLNGSARVDGAVQQLLGEALTFSGNVAIGGDLRVPGSPRVVQNGASAIGATATGVGSAQPDDYRLTLNGRAQIGRLLTRTDSITLPDVGASALPPGTRDVTISQAGQPLGDPATIRNLTLNGNVGTVSLPPGNYGRITINGSSTLVLGVAGNTQPASYAFQSLTLNGNSYMSLASPVQITLATGSAWNGILGASDHPAWLTLRVADGDVTLNGGAALYGALDAPASTVTLNGNATLVGTLHADRLTLTGSSTIRPSASSRSTPLRGPQ